MLLLLACATPDDTAPKTVDSGTTDSGTTNSGTTDSGTTDDLPAWYVNCSTGDDAADGTTPETAWRSLTRLGTATLLPGDTVHLARGTTCAGPLTLPSSGAPGAPITITAYGDGAAPIIDGAGLDAAVMIQDQDGFTLSDLEITGATRWGVYIGVSAGKAADITLRDLEVHDVWGGPPDAKGTGLVVLTVEGEGAWFEDVTVSGVTAWNTDRWSGIYLYGVAWRSGGTRSARITYADNVVHDVGGDGIVVFGADDVLIETSLAYEVGQTPEDTVGTPNGIWTWDCHDCVVQFNEAHHVHSPGVDGGAFDIDYDTVDNVVQYNYGHDNDGYCVAVFAAEGSQTDGAVVRHNLCRDNGQAEARAYQGDLFTYAWNGGSLGAVQIYGNTVLRSTAWGYPPLVSYATLGAGSGVWNNLFVVDGDWMATVAGDVALGHNLWWQTGAHTAAWFDDAADGWSDGLDAWAAVSGEAGSIWADPRLDGSDGRDGLRLTAGSPAVDMAEARPEDACDAFGGRIDGAPDIGAHELDAAADASCSP